MDTARVARRGVLSVLALAAGPHPGLAATTLDRPARILVGSPPGGGTDLSARLLADQLRDRYAPQVLVENRSGASGRLASEAVKAAAPDGMTMLLAPVPVMTLFRATAEAVATPAMQAGLMRLEFRPGVMPQPAFVARIRTEREAWPPIVQATGFTAND